MSSSSEYSPGALRLTSRFFCLFISQVWTGPISVGTPPVVYNCYFDLGSTDLSLASSTCTDESCNGKARYDVSKSSTAKPTTFKVQSSWLTGTSGSGQLVRDTVTIGRSTVTSQDVVAETSIGSYVSTRASDGSVMSRTLISPFERHNR